MAKDEEYHFKDAESPVSYTTGPSQLNKDKEDQARLKRRKIISMAFMFLIFWGGYKLITLFFEQLKKNPAPKHATVPTKTAPPQSIVSSPPSLSNAQIEEISAQKARMDTIESQLINLQSTLAETNDKLNDLSSKMAKPEPSAPIKQPVRHPSHEVREKRELPPPRPPYYLEAALPGRAWLMRRDGVSVTIALGDKIPGYGVVVTIDPNEGFVQTSSGAIIKYR